ncbi:MAG: hypothetical protein ACOX88_09195 [Christensenellales bacterium]|jgi:ABC-2 type transport system permease protein
MFKTLLFVRLRALWDNLFARMGNRSGKKSKGLGILLGIAVIYAMVVLLGLMSVMFMSLAAGMVAAGMPWLYFTMAGLMSVGFCFVGSVFIAEKQMFDSSDNELLLSMPVPPSYILATRLSTLFILNSLYNLLVMVPAGIIFAIAGHATAPQIIKFIFLTLLLPLIPTALTCVVGWVIGSVSSRMRHKNLISSILMIGMFLLYMYLMLNLNRYMQDLIANGIAIGRAVARAFPPLYYFGTGVTGGVADFAGFLAWAVILFAALYAVLSRTFLKIVTRKKGHVRVRYVEKPLDVSSPRRALFKKELRRLFSLPIYVFNAAMGSVMLLILAGFILVQGPKVQTMLAQFFGAAGGGSAIAFGIVVAAASFCAAMNVTTAPAISLEGKAIVLLKSLPVSAKDVFLAKINVNLLVGLPAIIIVAAAAWLRLPVTPLQGLLVLAVPAACQVFAALYGLACNIWMPRFDWISEVMVIKQSGSVALAVLTAMAVVMLPMGLYPAVLARFIGLELFLILATGVLLAASAGLYAYLMRGGAKRYDRL